MLYPEKVKILAKKNQPKPEEAKYWMNLTADPYGNVEGMEWFNLDKSICQFRS